MIKTEVYVLCEGYHDRAFWKGLLLALQCTDPGVGSGDLRKAVDDPWGRPVRGGSFAFHGPKGKFIRVVPVKGRGNILPAARRRLGERDQNPISHLVINCDSDQNADGTNSVRRELQFGTVGQMVQEFDSQASQTGEHTIAMDGGATTVHSFPWRVNDPMTPGLPNQQTLERLISAAIVSAHPNRADTVENWLRSRPDPPASDPKEHALSDLAGWYADRGGYEAFCERLWEDPDIKTELEGRLREQGILKLLQAVVA